MGSLIRRGDLVFDIGAHTGSKARVFLAAGARVVCVEPQPPCVATLRQRFRFSRRLTIVPQALGARMGSQVLSICRRADVLSTFSERWKQGRFAAFEWDEQVEVEMSTLDQLIAQHGVPRYCKIDVEGFELEVLQGLSQPIPFLSIEYAIEFRADAAACVRRLEALGYQRFNVSRADSGTLALETWCTSETLLAWLEAEAETDPMAWGDIHASTDLEPLVTSLPLPPPGPLRQVLRRLVDALRVNAAGAP